MLSMGDVITAEPGQYILEVLPLINRFKKESIATLNEALIVDIVILWPGNNYKEVSSGRRCAEPVMNTPKVRLIV